MNPTDYYEIHMELVHAISSVWEIWLTITFATIVAFHLGRHSINGVLLSIATFLYLGAAVTTIGRFVMYIRSIGLLRQEALDAGLTGFPTNSDMGYFVVILTMITMGIGTIATIGFAIYQYKHQG